MRKFIRKIEKNRVIPYAMLALSIVMIIAGVMRDEHVVVLKKAGNICLECIGIGEEEKDED